MSFTTGPGQSANGLQVGIKVQIIGERGFYLVSSIDQRRHTVDLVPLNGGQAVRGVHISSITIPFEHHTAMSLFARLNRHDDEAA